MGTLLRLIWGLEIDDLKVLSDPNHSRILLGSLVKRGAEPSTQWSVTHYRGKIKSFFLLLPTVTFRGGSQFPIASHRSPGRAWRDLHQQRDSDPAVALTAAPGVRRSPIPSAGRSRGSQCQHPQAARPFRPKGRPGGAAEGLSSRRGGPAVGTGG